MTEPAPIVPRAVQARAHTTGRFRVAPGRRTVWLLLAGCLWIVPALADARFVAALFLWDALVVAAWLVDLRRIPPPDQLLITRRWLGAMALGVPAEVEVVVDNQSGVDVRATLVDAVPWQVRAEPASVSLTAAAGQEGRRTYAIAPVRRGHQAVGHAHVRYGTALQLAERWAVADLGQTVLTYPNLAEARRHSMHLVGARQTDAGKRTVRLRGQGRAFESLREYRAGDEARDICWTASARRGKLVTRLYEVERSQTIWALVDSGRLMRARTAGQSKLDHAVGAVLAMAQVALGGGDRVGLIAYGRKITQRLSAARGQAHLKHLLDALAQMTEDEWEADHVLAAGRLLTDQRRRALVVWITDLAESTMTPEVVRAATHLMQRHVVLFVVIGDPDLQATARRTPASEAEMFETAAAQEVTLRREVLLSKLREGGALALETDAAGLAPAVVRGYLEVKQRNLV